MKNLFKLLTAAILTIPCIFFFAGCGAKKDVEVRVKDGYIQWSYDGDDDWTNVISVKDVEDSLSDSIKGEDGVDGKQIELRKGETHIQWRYVGESEWTNLIAIEDLKDEVQDEQPVQEVSYINKTFYTSTTKASQPQPVIVTASAELTQPEEFGIVATKLLSNKEVLLVYQGQPYRGTYYEKALENSHEDAKQYILCIDDYTIKMNVDSNSCILEDISKGDKLFSGKIDSMSEKQDYVLKDGLYRGIGSATGDQNGKYDYSDEIEYGAFTYKIGDAIYSSDSVCHAEKLEIFTLGNVLYYTNYSDVQGNIFETNLFFIENKGEHDAEFVECFGDLDNVIYHIEREGGRDNKYFEALQTEYDERDLVIDRNIIFNATKYFIQEGYYNYENSLSNEKYNTQGVELQLEINIDKTVNLIVNNMKYSGKWYNIGQGILVVLDNNDFFGGYFALGEYTEDICTQEFFKSKANTEIKLLDRTSYIAGNEISEEIRYNIYWNEQVEFEKDKEWAFKENPQMYVNKTYYTETADGVVAVKLKSGEKDAYNNIIGEAIFSYKGAWYVGSYMTGSHYNRGYIFEVADNEIHLQITENGATITDTTFFGEKLFEGTINLTEKEDVVLPNGLYRGVASYNLTTNTYGGIESGSWTYKVSDTEFYGQDSSINAWRSEVEVLGNLIWYRDICDEFGTIYQESYAIYERKGEHTSEFVANFGDLDHVIGWYEAEDDTIYYESLQTEPQINDLKINNNITLNATKLYEYAIFSGTDLNEDGTTEPWIDEKYIISNVDREITIKTDGSVVLSVGERQSSGKWYNIGQGILVVLENKGMYDIFAIGANNDDGVCTEEYFKKYASSLIFVTNSKTISEYSTIEHEHVQMIVWGGQEVEDAISAEWEGFFD